MAFEKDILKCYLKKKTFRKNDLKKFVYEKFFFIQIS